MEELVLRRDPIDELRRQWSDRWPGAHRAGLAATIMRVSQIVEARLNEAVKPLGITLARAEALILLHFSRNGSLPMGKISELLMINPASVTGVVDHLEKHGYVQRKYQSDDRRLTFAEITEEGRQLAIKSADAMIEAQNGVGGLDDHELLRLQDLLETFRRSAGDLG